MGESGIQISSLGEDLISKTIPEIMRRRRASSRAKRGFRPEGPRKLRVAVSSAKRSFYARRRSGLPEGRPDRRKGMRLDTC